MTLIHSNDKEFIERFTELVAANLRDENLSVKELAALSGMSVSSLNQRLHSINGMHLSQFIREVRLHKAMELLQNGRYTAAEISYQVGFSSPSYFNKCFHDLFGYPPGKVRLNGSTGPESQGLFVPVIGDEKKLRQKKAGWIILSSLILLVLLVTFAISLSRNYPMQGTAGSQFRDTGRTSIAIFPFRNMTDDNSWDIWQEGIQSCLINSLSNSKDLALQSEQSINSIVQKEGEVNYASLKPDLAGAVAKKLGAEVFICGNINKAGTMIRLNAQLIGADDRQSISSFHIDGQENEILEIIDSLSALISNALVMAELKKVAPAAIHDFSEHTTKSTEAYRYFIHGNLAYFRNDFNTAINCYMQALAIDSTFYRPMAKIATAYYNIPNYEQARFWYIRYYSRKDEMNMVDRITAESLYALFFTNHYDRIKYLRQLLDFDSQNPMTYFSIGDSYFEMMQYDKGIPEFEHALELFRKFDIKPYWGAFYYELGICYHKTGQYSKERKLYRQAEKDFPDDPGLMDQQAWLELSLGNVREAGYYLDKWTSIRREEGWTEGHIQSYLAYVYSMAGMTDMEEQCYRKALSLDPEKVGRMNNLAYFLIDTERNINEGLALVEKALKSDPENFNSIHVKGYALYKQHQFTEALALMEKSWSLRMQHSIYHHRTFLQLEEARKAVLNPENTSPV